MLLEEHLSHVPLWKERYGFVHGAKDRRRGAVGGGRHSFERNEHMLRPERELQTFKFLEYQINML